MKTAFKSRKTLTALKKLSAAAAIAAISSTVAISKAEAAIIQVNPTTLTAVGEINFDDVIVNFDPITGYYPGNNYDGIGFGQNVNNPTDPTDGAYFAQNFVGQTVTPGGGLFPYYDVVSGSPTNPLTLQVGPTGQNLSIGGREGILYGLGPLGFRNFDAIGEGAIAILFDRDQSEFGFNLEGSPDSDPNKQVYLSFFRRDGSLIDDITLDQPIPFGPLGFKTDTGIREIAGVSISNFGSHGGGIGIDFIVYDPDITPGLTPFNPILPTPNPNNPNGFTFANIIIRPGFGLGRPIFGDPDVAVGYDYSVTGGPLFASVLIPSPLPQGDSNFTLELPGFGNYSLVAGTTFDLLGINSSGFDKFRISGIDLAEMLAPTNPTAFVTGLTFTNPGIVTITQNPIVQNTDGVSVPDPSNLFGLGLIGFGAFFRRQLNKKKPDQKDA